MHIKSLSVFKTLLECGSMRKAAQQLQTTPTTIARHIDNLEYHFGAALVERLPSGIRLTGAGELLRDHGLPSFMRLAHVKRLIDDLTELRIGHLTIRTVGIAVNEVVAPAVARFAAIYPGISLNIDISGGQEAIAAVEGGDVDMAISVSIREDISRIPISEQMTFAAIMAPDHPLAAQERVALAQIIKHGLMLPDGSYTMRQVIERRFTEQNLPATPRFTFNSMQMLKEMAIIGAGVMIMTPVAVLRERQQGILVTRPLDCTPIWSNYQLIEPLDRSPTAAMQAFRRHLMDHILMTSGQAPEVMGVSNTVTPSLVK